MKAQLVGKAMSLGWIETLREQGELVKLMASTVSAAHSRHNLTVLEASRIHRLVDTGAQDFDRIVEQMNDCDLNDALYEAAETLEHIWTNLSVAAANKVRRLRSLPGFEIPLDLTDDDLKL